MSALHICMHLFSVFFISGNMPFAVGGLMNEATNAFLNIAIAKKENHDCDCSELLLGSVSMFFPLTSFEPQDSVYFFFAVSVQQTFHYVLVEDLWTFCFSILKLTFSKVWLLLIYFQWIFKKINYQR